MPKPPSKELDQFTVRFPDGLRDRIKAIAAENGRSMNAEIVATLEKAYPLPSINVRDLSGLLISIAGAETEEEYQAQIAEVNLAFAKSDQHWTVQEEDGVVKFYPYRTKPSD